MTGVYMILNSLTGGRYIGSSAVDLDKRWDNHRYHLGRKTHHNYRLQAAWSIGRPEAFVFSVIEECAPDLVIPRETHWIKELKPEYNLCEVSDSALGIKRSEVFKAKVSASKMGHAVSKETRDKIRLTKIGLKQSKETIEKRRLKLTGLRRSAECCARFSGAHMGKSNGPWTPEQRANHMAAIRRRIR